MSNFFILFISYFLILFSILGYGSFLSRLHQSTMSINIGFKGVYGIFFLIIYSYLSHYFISHNLKHNVVILLIGILIFILNFKKEFDKKNFFILTISFIILFIGLLIFKTHDDFPYYHFGYSYYLTQEPMIIGIGQYNHGFRTPSSILYLNSLFYLPFIRYFSFEIPALLILGFSNLILFFSIKEYFKRKKFNYIFYLNLLFLAFLNIFFYRIQEHGTDRSAQILISILFIQILTLINFDKSYKTQISNILVLLGIIVSLKAFYILYLVVILPLIWIFYKEKKLNTSIWYLLKNKFFYLFLLLVLLTLLVYFFNTGCLIYPLSVSCFNNFEWSLGVEQALKMNNHYNLWSKGGHTPNFKVSDPETHLQNFNWVSNWINIYFFNKVSDFLIGLLALVVITFIIFNSKKNKKLKLNYSKKNIILIYSIVLILFFEWFVNHPSLRYGGYILVSLLLFIPFSIFLEKNQITIDKLKLKLKILISITIIVFISRNAVRINNEIEQYNYKPISNSFYRMDEGHFRIAANFEDLKKNYKDCKDKLKTCDLKRSKYVREVYPGRYIFITDFYLTKDD